MHVDLPNGQSAELATYDELPIKVVRKVNAVRRSMEIANNRAVEAIQAEARALGIPVPPDTVKSEDFPEDYTALFNTAHAAELFEPVRVLGESLADAAIVASVTSWTLGPLPTDDTVGDLPVSVVDVLAPAANRALMPTDFGVNLDPKAPTPDSIESAGS